MKKYCNILSLLMVIVYGTLTLVAVPLHHHTLEYVDTPQYQSTAVDHSSDCNVCTLAYASYTCSSSSATTIEFSDDPGQCITPESVTVSSSLHSVEYPRRGPPAFLL